MKTFPPYPRLLIVPVILALWSTSPLAAQNTIDSVRRMLVDKNATSETAALFYNLQKLAAEGKTLVGQQDPEVTATGRKESTDIKWVTEKELAVWGHDYMGIARATLPGDPNEDDVRRGSEYQAARTIDLAIGAYDQGIVNVFCWHMGDPVKLTFYANELPEDLRSTTLRELLPGGAYHEWYKGRLRTVAEVAGKIKGKNGTLSPIIFRPFHEFDGSWFWWGKSFCTPKEFVDCWRFTVKYLRDELGVRNFLYAFSPDIGFDSEAVYLERYPGDAYVDIVGFDNYYDFEIKRIDGAAKRLAIVSNFAIKRGKVAALTEVGYRNEPLPLDLYTGYYGEAFADPSLQIAFFMFWRQGPNPPFVPSPDSPLAKDFKKFINSPRMVLLPDVGNLYTFPVNQSAAPQNR